MAWSLAWRTMQWRVLTLRLMLKARRDPEQVGAAAPDHLMYDGDVMMAHHRMALAPATTLLQTSARDLAGW